MDDGSVFYLMMNVAVNLCAGDSSVPFPDAFPGSRSECSPSVCL
jgi:hypothetical protein